MVQVFILALQAPVGELNRNEQHFKTIKPHKTAKNKQNLEMQNTHCFRLFDIANEEKKPKHFLDTNQARE